MWLVIVLSFLGGFIVGSGITYVVVKPRNVGVLVVNSTDANSDDLFMLELHQNVNDIYKKNKVELDVRRV